VNSGFAVANNYASQQANGEYILFLNPDTEISPEALDRLVGELNTRPEVGVAGPKLLNEDGSTQGSVQAFPTLMNQALDSNILRRLLSRSVFRGMNEVLLSDSGSAQVEMVSGACLMMPTRLFREVGGFTEEFFMYSEDVDLCWKVRHAGRQVRYLPSATVIHTGGQSSSRRSSHFSSVLQRDSTYRFLCLTRGVCYAWSYRVLMTLVSVVRLAILSIGVLFTANERRLDVIHAMGKWSRILSWGVGGQRWASRLNDSISSSGKRWRMRFTRTSKARKDAITRP
jgi:N-acetylglucosaminyl-diphospho-decaprenol L-rhamnosyltransferase